MREIALTGLRTANATAKVKDAEAKTARDNVDAYVALCRNLGCSWDEIAEVIGITKQRAHTRFSSRIGPRDPEILRAAERLEYSGPDDDDGLGDEAPT